MPVRSRMMDKPLYMLDLETAADASPTSLVLPRRTLWARVFRVSSGYVCYQIVSYFQGMQGNILTQNQGTVLQIAPAIMGPPKGEVSGPSVLAATCLTVS